MIALFDTWPWCISQCQYTTPESPTKTLELYWMQKHQATSHIVVHQTNKWLIEQSNRCMVSWKEDGNFFIMSQRALGSSYLYILKPSELSKPSNKHLVFLFSFLFKLHSYRSWYYLSLSRNVFYSNSLACFISPIKKGNKTVFNEVLQTHSESFC